MNFVPGGSAHQCRLIWEPALQVRGMISGASDTESEAMFGCCQHH